MEERRGRERSLMEPRFSNPLKGGHRSAVSVSDILEAQPSSRERIRASIQQRSSRLLSFLGLRNPAQALKTYNAPHALSVSSSEMEISLHHEGVENPNTHYATPSAFEPVTESSPGKSKGQAQPERQSTDPETIASTIPVDFRRSQSTPVDLARIISLKISTTFGSPTVIRRSHLNSRPSIHTVQFPPPLNATLSVGLIDNSDSSTSRSSNDSPENSSSTPPTSEGQSGSPGGSDRSKELITEPISMSRYHLFQPRDEEDAMSPVKETQLASPSILTVEAAANAKVFLEAYFNVLYSGLDSRTQRQYEIDQYLVSLPLTPEEKIRVKKKWFAQEREHLRQCRVLKSRSHSSSSTQNETSSLAGFEVIKVLGKGSFGVVRLVKEKDAVYNNDKRSTHDTSRMSSDGDAAERKPHARRLLQPPQLASTYNERHVMTGVKKNVFAMKVIRKSVMIRNSQEGHLRAERDFLVASAKSRWIVPLIASFQDTSYLYLVMDYMVGGDFLGLLMRRNILEESIARWYVAEMILCVEEAHRLRWIHRDIKPDNFLISASGHLKISDFGLAFDGHWAHDQWYFTYQRHSLVQRLGIQVDGDSEDQKEAQGKAEASSAAVTRGGGVVEDDWIHPPTKGLLSWRDRNQKRRFARSVVGTSQYMAPEVIRGHPYDGRCDWWSVGIILYECLYGFTPFASEDRHKTKLKIHHHLQTLYFPVHRSSDKLVSAEAADLINCLLQEKEYRLSSSKYKANDALNPRPSRSFLYKPDASNLNYQGFYVYPDDATDIKAHPFFRGINWDDIHRTCPPFIPKVKSWEDTRYFDDGGYPSDHDDVSSDSDCDHARDDGVPGDDKEDAGEEKSKPQRNNPCAAPDIKEGSQEVTKPSGKGKKKRQEPRRPRDKLLRDKRLRKTVLEMRKKGAFLGYTYRRPKGAILALNPERGRPYISRGQLSELYG